MMYDTRMNDKEHTPPTDKQLKYCYQLLERVGTCDADESGQPLFELSMANADSFIKQNRSGKTFRETECSAGDWGGIPNH